MFAMSRQLKGALMAAGGGVCWGISGTMGQYLFTHEAMHTTWLIPIRLSLAGLILFVYWLVKDRRLLFAPWRQRDSAVMLVLYGIFGISLSQFLYFLTIQFSNAAIGTIMQDLSPVMVLLVACATAHRKPRAYEIVSIVLALLGVILLTTHGDLTTFAVSPVALVAGVACAVCVTVYNCLCPRRELRDYPVSMLQAWAFLMGAVLFELSMHPWTLGYTPSLRGVGGILFVVLFGNLLAFNLYMTGVKLIGPEKSVLYGFAEPVSGAELERRSIENAKRLGVRFVTAEAVGLTYTDKLTVETVDKNYPADAVILATGASRAVPRIPGLAGLEGHGVSYCAACDAFFYRGKDVAVLGSGEYALHEVQALLPVAKSVALLTNGAPLTADFPPEVTVYPQAVEAVLGETVVTGVQLSGGVQLPVSGVFVALGVAGSTALARKIGAEVDGNRIVVDEKMQTTVPGLYAAGDCTGGLLQVAKAVYEGAQAGTEAAKALRKG